MLDALCKLGELYIDKENLDEFDVLVDEKNIKDVILVEFIENDDSISFNKIFYEVLIGISADWICHMCFLTERAGSKTGVSKLYQCIMKTIFVYCFQNSFNSIRQLYSLRKYISRLVSPYKQDV